MSPSDRMTDAGDLRAHVFLADQDASEDSRGRLGTLDV